jgi:hypothetical protein
MPTQSEAIHTYLRAKDENRPHLMKSAFAETAVLEMAVNSGVISFPPFSNGVDAITKILVQDFGKAYENVYTFCLTSPPKGKGTQFSCNWLVGMSLKEGGAVRVGCGRYDWFFQADAPGLVERLKITIDTMQALTADNLSPIMNRLSNLPYPWCPPDDAIGGLPSLAGLEPIVSYIKQSRVRESAL